MKCSAFHVATASFADGPRRIASRVVLAARTGEACVLDEGTWLAVQDGTLERIEPAVLAELIDLELLVPYAEDEATVVLGRGRAAVADDDGLSVVVGATASAAAALAGSDSSRCDHDGPDGPLRSLVLDARDHDGAPALVRTEIASGSFGTVAITWCDVGVPLPVEAIRRLGPALRRLAAEAGIRCRSRFVTDSHGPTGRTVAAVRAALEASPGPSLAVRIVVDGSNAGAVEPLLADLHGAGLARHLSVTFDRRAVTHDGGHDGDGPAPMSPDDFARRELGWFTTLDRHGFTPVRIPPVRPVTCSRIEPGSDLACVRCPVLPVCGGRCPEHWTGGRVPCPSVRYTAVARLHALHEHASAATVRGHGP